MTDTSEEAFITYWSKQVAEEFNLDVATIEALYGQSDEHNTQWRIREMWKYATAKGVNATPTYFVNGVHLDAVPFSVDDWMKFLNTTYESQWHPATVKANDACPITEGSATYWCQSTSSCIAGSPTDFSCPTAGDTCCHHYCSEENGCIVEEEEEEEDTACPLVEGSATYWCQDTSSCIAGSPTDFSCPTAGQTCCHHYCSEENGCLEEEEEETNGACKEG